jgi:3-hydroxypropanoate dehydrogenase
MAGHVLDDPSLDTLFRTARSQNGWRPEPVSDAQLHALYELMKWGPTSANQSPARIVFVRSTAAKERLKASLSPSNVDKVMTAPVVAIVAYDLAFYELIPRLFPHNPGARDWYAGPEKAAAAATSAFRNGTLQGAYMMIAARALGLDCGPMSGFDNAAVDAAFFAGTTLKSNFLCGIGYGDPAKVYTRSPRLAFEEACSIV